jgi:lipid II:glycine glycyltransferase (peptidoglycan interpeptide bridge formation enzyme)
MAEITVSIIENEKIWEDFLENHPEANFLQSWYWGEFHEALGQKIHRTGFYRLGKLVGVMLAIAEDARRGRYITVPGGPIIDWEDSALVQAFVEEIRKISKAEKCIFARIRPQLEKTDFSKKIFKQHGFIKAPMHLHAEYTSQLDITKSEEELLAAMRKNTRYEIKKALNMKIKITSTDDSSAIKNFYKLQLDTAKRQNFVPFNYKFLLEQFKVFSKVKKVSLYSATFEKKLLAQAFVIFYGQEAVYHYGASTLYGRKYPGAYLLQWEAIKEAKIRGLKRYNFWGIVSESQRKHRFYGVSVFKRGFGGSDLEYLPAQDLVIDKYRYLPIYLLETIRKKVRRL